VTGFDGVGVFFSGEPARRCKGFSVARFERPIRIEDEPMVGVVLAEHGDGVATGVEQREPVGPGGVHLALTCMRRSDMKEAPTLFDRDSGVNRRSLTEVFLVAISDGFEEGVAGVAAEFSAATFAFGEASKDGLESCGSDDESPASSGNTKPTDCFTATSTCPSMICTSSSECSTRFIDGLSRVAVFVAVVMAGTDSVPAFFLSAFTFFSFFSVGFFAFFVATKSSSLSE